MVPSIQRAMINPHEFKWASTCAYSIVWVVYMIFGAAGYLMFGAGVRPEITQSVAAVTEFKGVLTTLTLGLIAVSIFSKYSLVLKPVFRLFEEKVQTGSFASIAVRVAISIFVVLASIVFPSFLHAMGLLGCLFSFSVAVIVPLTCALKLKVGNTREHMILLVFGISMAVVGLYGVA